jgi:hypothetical protein
MEWLIIAAVLAAAAAAVLFVARADWFGTRGPGLSPAFRRADQARTIPPELVKYERVVAIPTGFTSARGVAVGPDDRIYVAGDRAVRVFDAAGARVGTPIAGLPDEPRCLAVARDGRVYLGVAQRVEVRAPDGALEKTLPPGARGGLVNRIVLHERGVFVALHRTAGAGSIVQYDEAGALRDELVLEDVNMLNHLLDVAVAADGLRVTDAGAVSGRIRVYGFDGQRKFAWGDYDTTGDLAALSGCCNPVHLAMLPGGRLVTSEKGQQAVVKVYHKDSPEDHGRLESVVAAMERAAGLDLAVDSRQRVLVLDAGASAVYVFRRRGG